MERLLFISGIVAPVFIVMAVGYAIRHFRIVSREAFAGFSKVVFYTALPCLLFQEVSSLDLRQVDGWFIIILINVLTAAFFLMLLFLVRLLGWPGNQQGVFVQGGFRSNMAFVGLALCLNAFGQKGLAFAAVIFP